MSLQLCLTLCDPIDGSPPSSAIPGILQARTLEWVAISFSSAWNKSTMLPCRKLSARLSLILWIMHTYLQQLFLQRFIELNGNPLQYSCLENPMDRGAWWAAVHGVAKSRRQLSNFSFTFPFHALEKEMATHSSVLAWRIPGMGEPSGLPSMGSHRVGHD